MNRSALPAVEESLQKNLDVYFPDSDPDFIIAVSGGADSMALLYALHRCKVGGLAVHINYGKRGVESEKDQELVENLAPEWGFDCQVVRADLPRDTALNFQQWARDFRYDVFRGLAKDRAADGIALAHHRDDQLETILQKMFRGAGLMAWSGMDNWDGELFRPLLDISKEQILHYCRAMAIPFRTDRSNLESDFARNFLRNEWLPELEKHFPGWEQNVLRLASQGELFEKALGWIKSRISESGDRLVRRELLDLPPELQKTVILEMAKDLQADAVVSRGALKEMDKLPALQTGRSLELTKQFHIIRDRSHFVIQSKAGTEEGETEITREDLEERAIAVRNIELGLVGVEGADLHEDRAIYLDADAMTWPLKLRRWRQGDRFSPLGMQGHQKVSDHLTNRKIRADLKGEAMVLQTFEETICAVIFPPIENRPSPGTVAETAKCTDQTRRCLAIRKR